MLFSPCDCCGVDCNDIAFPHYIWFDANNDGTYELGPYLMTYDSGTELHTYDYVRSGLASLASDCDTLISTRVASICYFKIRTGANAGKNAVWHAVPACNETGLGGGSGYRAAYGTTPAPWTRPNLAIEPSISPMWDPFVTNYNSWVVVGPAVTTDACLWEAKTGNGATLGLGNTGVYKHRITRGSTAY